MAEKPAYIVVDVDIHNPEIYEDYKAGCAYRNSLWR